MMMLIVAACKFAFEWIFGLLYTGEDVLQQYAILALLVSIGAIYLPALWFVKDKEPQEYGKLPLSVPAIIWSVILGFGLSRLSDGITIVTSLVCELIGLPMLNAIMPSVEGWRFFATLFLVAVLPALAEETLFRGAYLNALRPLGRRKAVWITAAAFTLLHGSPTSIPAILVVALVFGYLAYDIGSFYPTMIAHGTINAVSVITYTLAQSVDYTAVGTPTTQDYLAYSAVYMVIGGLITLIAFKRLMARALMMRRIRETGVQPKPGEVVILTRPDEPEPTEKNIGAFNWAALALLAAVNIGVLIMLISIKPA